MSYGAGWVAATIGLFLWSGCVHCDGKNTRGSVQSESLALHRAVREGDQVRVAELIHEGWNVNDRSDPKMLTPLNISAEKGDLGMAKLLVANGADVNLEAPLTRAAMYGRVEMVEYLLTQGADVNHCSPGVSTPAALLATCNVICGNAEVVKVLVGAGIDMQFKDNQYIPLNQAAMNGHVEMVRYLLSQGADVNRQDSRGWTPMHRAAYGGHVKVINILLKAGGDPRVRSGDEGKTPGELAGTRGHTVIQEMLK